MRRSILLILSALGALTTAAAAPLTYYVSPQGDDSHSGTITAPFRTLSKARDAIRSDTGRNSTSQTQIQGNWEGATVIIRNGTYPSFALDGRDSGTESDPIVYRAANGEQVKISGAAEITEGHWTPVRDPLYPDAHPKVRQLALYKFNIKDSNDLNTPGPRTEFYVDGKPIRSRVQNLEELKQPGEWFLDAGRNQLFYFPKNENELKNASLSSVDTVFSATGTRWTKLENLTIEGSRSHGVVLKDTDNITFSSVTVRNTGEWGIRVEGGTGAFVSNAIVTETGSGGIFVDGGDGASGVTSGHTVENAEIRDFAKTWQSEPGIMLMGFGNRVAGSSITGSSDAVEPDYGILIGGAHGNIVRQNVFSNCEIPIFISPSGGLLAGKNEIVDNRSIDNSWLVDGDGAAVQLTQLNFSSDGVTKVQLGDLLKSTSSSPLLPTPTTGLVFYVSPTGNDSNTGSSPQSPLATLEGARNALRAATGRTANGTSAISGGWTGATVIFAGGSYSFVNGAISSHPVVFDERDSGTSEFPIVYRAEQGAKVIFTGAYQLSDDGWALASTGDASRYAALPDSVDQDVYFYDLTGSGIPNGIDGSESNPDDTSRLIVNDEIMMWSRWPDAGAGYAKDMKDSTKNGWSKYTNPTASSVTVSGTTPANWNVELNDGWVYGTLRNAYNIYWNDVTSLSSNGGNTIVGVNRNNWGTPSLSRFISLRNFLETLDAPGDTVLVKGNLYYLPETPGKPTGTSLTYAKAMIVLGEENSPSKATNFVTFEDLIMEGSQDGMFRAYETTGLTIRNCELRNGGGANGALIIEDATDLVIQNNYIHHWASAAGWIHGGDFATLTDGNILFDGNEVAHIGFDAQQTIRDALTFKKNNNSKTAVSGRSVGITVSNNHFHHTRDGAVSSGGTANFTFSGNTLDRCVMVLGDAGAAGTGGFHFTTINQVWSNNTFSNIRRLGDEEGDDLQHQSNGAIVALYQDLNWGWSVVDNIFTNCDQAMLIGGGKNFTISRNKFINAGVGHYGAPIIFGTRVTSGHSAPGAVPHDVLMADLTSVNLTSLPWSSVVGNMTTYRSGKNNYDIAFYYEGVVVADNMVTNGKFLARFDSSAGDQWPQTVSGKSVGIATNQRQYPIGATGTPTEGGGTVALSTMLSAGSSPP